MAFEQDNLGPSGSWHVRSLPESVKQAFVDRAHAQRLTIGELLTRMVTGGELTAVAPVAPGEPNAVALVDGGAVTQVSHTVAPTVDGVDVLRVTHRGDTGNAVATVPHAVDAGRLLTLLQAADLLNKVILPPTAYAATKTLIGAELRMMRRGQRVALARALAAMPLSAEQLQRATRMALSNAAMANYEGTSAV